MKAFVIHCFFIVVSFIFAGVIVSNAQANPKYASFVMEEISGRVLFSRNADKQLYPASLAKIMTLYIIFEELQSKNLTLNSQVIISKLAVP